MTHLRNAGGDAANGLQRIILGSGISGKPYAAAALHSSYLSHHLNSFPIFPTKDAADSRQVERKKIDFILFLYRSRAAKTHTMCF